MAVIARVRNSDLLKLTLFNLNLYRIEAEPDRIACRIESA